MVNEEKVIDTVEDKTADMNKYYEEEANAVSQINRSLEAFRKAYLDGEITDEMLEQISANKEMGSKGGEELLRYCKMSRLEMEQDSYYKSDLSDTYTYTVPIKDGESVTFGDCTITRHGYTYHCESEYLGTFDYKNTHYKADGTSAVAHKLVYNPSTGRMEEAGYQDNRDEWEVGYKIIKEDDGSESYLPVLKYVGTDVCIKPNFITGQSEYPPTNCPEGVKHLDYTFAGKTGLELSLDKIPDSVETMHCMYKGCSNMYMWDNWGSYKMEIPESVTDISGAFDGCSKLQGTFLTRTEDGKTIDQLPEGLVSAIAGFRGCERLDDVLRKPDHYGTWPWQHRGKNGELEDKNTMFDLPKFGENYTPYLAAEYAKGVFDEIASTNPLRDDKYVENYQAGVGFNIDHGQVKNAEGLDADILSRSQAASTQVSSGKVLDGHIITNPELMSDISTTHTIKDADGKFVNDWTGLKTSLKNRLQESDTTFERLIIYGGLGALTAKITNKGFVGLAVGVGGFFASEHLDFLPTSFYPIVNFTANLLPDCAIKTKLLDWSKSLAGYAHEQNKEIDKHNAELIEANKFYDDQYNVGDTWKEKRVSKIFDDAALSINDGITCNKFMQENAKECSKQMTFIAVAMSGDGIDTTCPYVKNVLDPTLKSMTDQWSSRISGSPTETQRNQMRDYYLNMISALEAYDKGAKLGDEVYYPDNDLNKDLSEMGRNIVNRSYMDSVMSSLVAADKQYHFMDDKTWEKIESFDITGVDIKNIRNYDTSYMDRVASLEYEKLCYAQAKFRISREGTEEEKSDPNNQYDPAYAASLSASGLSIYDYGYDSHKYDSAVSAGMPSSAREQALGVDKDKALQALHEAREAMNDGIMPEPVSNAVKPVSDTVKGQDSVVNKDQGKNKTDSLLEYGYDPHKYDNAVGMPSSSKEAALAADKAAAELRMRNAQSFVEPDIDDSDSIDHSDRSIAD